MSLSLFNPTFVDSFFNDIPSMRSLERRLTDTSGQLANWRPRTDIRETDKAYLVSAEIPGARKEDVNVELHGNNLTIKGSVHDEKKNEGEKHYLYERSYGSFTRSFTLPDDADQQGIKAEHKNGVLHLEIPKKAKQEPQKIAIK